MGSRQLVQLVFGRLMVWTHAAVADSDRFSREAVFTSDFGRCCEELPDGMPAGLGAIASG